MKKFALLAVFAALALTPTSAQATHISSGDDGPTGHNVDNWTPDFSDHNNPANHVCDFLTCNTYQDKNTGFLSFDCVVSNPKSNSVNRCTFSGFNGCDVDIFCSYDGGKISPINCDRQDDDHIGFNFNNFDHGFQTCHIYIQTDCKDLKKFCDTAFFDTDNGCHVTFCPSPEPASLTLLAGCVSLFGFGSIRSPASASPCARMSRAAATPARPTMMKAVRQSKAAVSATIATGATPPPKKPENVCRE